MRSLQQSLSKCSKENIPMSSKQNRSHVLNKPKLIQVNKLQFIIIYFFLVVRTYKSNNALAFICFMHIQTSSKRFLIIFQTT